MIINKETNFGTIKIEIPFDIGDRFKVVYPYNSGSYIFSVNKIIVMPEQIFLVDNYSGIWLDIFTIKNVKVFKDGVKYLELKPEEKKEN